MCKTACNPLLIWLSCSTAACEKLVENVKKFWKSLLTIFFYRYPQFRFARFFGNVDKMFLSVEITSVNHFRIFVPLWKIIRPFS